MLASKMTGWLFLVLSQPLWAQENPYNYVKMSLFVPWLLYFVFLACVLIPFVLLILLAWRGHLKKTDTQDINEHG